MKYFLSLVVIATATLNACGTAKTSTSNILTGGTTNDLPNVILKCSETQDGALVLDGAVTLSVSKDQFGQYSVKILQKDQFSGNKELGEFLAVSKTTLNQSSLNSTYSAAENGKTMVLAVTKDSSNSRISFARLVLTTKQSANHRRVSFSCSSSK